ncbi:nitrilase-related carbon-nitrogen hydrolase [Kineococcus rhizosphaerae]|uniref:Putative amidohydrolase n=1 Tax=Kineococcus rhizosphaerae TaxID=559628 RepID=A0A2T0R0P4_9ACTN|nr:nitrilase-related carbon-nitrogen hydrolase [Kineococcus rhizosphaerae]PRY12866.1 putative amidohydrolase [Kineococcus rhizosphaerae]
MRVALSQLNSGTDPAANLDLARTEIAAAAAAGARLLVLPEAFSCRFGVPLGPVAEPVDGPWATALGDLADAAGITVVAGAFSPGRGGRVRNTLLARGAGVHDHYDKIHLYDAFGFAESDTVEAGARPVVLDVDGVGVGLATCYDVRFPGLFQTLADAGAQVVVVAASWGAGPGKVEQWELLARARALDCTSFVVACGQAEPPDAEGSAPTGVGHSRVVGPLGSVVAELGSAPGRLVVDLDLAEVAAARASLPVLLNRRF